MDDLPCAQVGDYMYEYGQDGPYPPVHDAVRWHGLQPPTETISLSDYRLRHALHRTDPDLQLLSAAAPLIAIWDDHEIANDPWVGGAQDHNEGEGDWWVRKRAAVRAYHEWMPTRTPVPPTCTGEADVECAGSHEGEHIYRHFRFGSLAALYVLETRLLARSEQAQLDASSQVEAIVGASPPEEWASDAALMEALVRLNSSWHASRDSNDRSLLGAEQLAWLRAAMASSSDATWQLLGQQIIVQPRRPMDLRLAASQRAARDPAKAAAWQELIDTLSAAPRDDGTTSRQTVTWYGGNAASAALYGRSVSLVPKMRAQARSLLARAAFGLNDDFDGWDGYPAARRRLLEVLREAGEPSGGRVAVYAGDSHAAWAGRLTTDDGAHVALEFDGTSVTCSGIDSWIPFLPPELVAAAYVDATPTLEYASTDTRGWMAVTLTPQAHKVAYMTVSTIGTRDNFSAACDAAFVQRAHAPDELRRVPCADVVALSDVKRQLGTYLDAATHNEPPADGSRGGASVGMTLLAGVVLGSLLTSGGYATCKRMRRWHRPHFFAGRLQEMTGC